MNDNSPFQTIVGALARVSKPRTSRDGTTVRACCPSCGGGNRSKLVITEKPGGGVLMHCFGGCDVADVAAACGVDLADLFPSNSKRNNRSTPANARHDAHTLTGLAREVILEAEFLLLMHAAQPIPGISNMLIERADELANIRVFLKKGTENGQQ